MLEKKKKKLIEKLLMNSYNLSPSKCKDTISAVAPLEFL